MSSSIKDSTLKQYDSALRKWREFCEEFLTDLYNPKVDDLQNFLIKCFIDGAKYSTLNTYRSAISLISRSKIGEDVLISRLMKALFNLNPPTSKNRFTWDPAVVLDYFQDLFPLEKLSFHDLTLKLVILLALSTAHRVQTLSKINIKNIHKTKEGFEILITESIKTSGRGKELPLLKIPKFLGNKKLCVASTLKYYLKVTESLRKNHFSLFVSLGKPHKAVGSQTISRWIKEGLRRSGIDTTRFTAHSTRHAATSKAFAMGVDIEIIRKTAGWSKNSQTFYNFYNHPVVNKKNTHFVKSVFK